jgi:hypothetical protein
MKQRREREMKEGYLIEKKLRETIILIAHPNVFFVFYF